MTYAIRPSDACIAVGGILLYSQRTDLREGDKSLQARAGNSLCVLSPVLQRFFAHNACSAGSPFPLTTVPGSDAV